MPSRKWVVASITGLTGIAVMVAEAGSWHVAETIALITFVSARAIAYLVPNDDTKGV